MKKIIFKHLNIQTNIKIITLTEKNITEEVEKGNFLKQLYDRLAVDEITTIPLSKRRDDILPILDYYLSEIGGNNQNLKFSKTALTKLQMYDWPGNVAQLINYVEKSLILNQDKTNSNEPEVDDLALKWEIVNIPLTHSLDLSLKDARYEFEKEYLLSQIKDLMVILIKFQNLLVWKELRFIEKSNL